MYYNSPSSTEEERKLVLEEIKSLNDPSGNTIICGDFNFPSINWVTMKADKSSQAFLDSTIDCYLQQIVTKPARNGRILDLVLASSATSQIYTSAASFVPPITIL